MSANPRAYESSVTAPPPGWAQPMPRDERVFLVIVLASVAVMTALVIGWLVFASHNVPSTSYPTTPAAFGAKVSALVERYGAGDGKVYLPAGTDGYLLASRYSWYPELVLEAGQKYRIWISSADVLHGFSLVGGGHRMGAT